MAISTFYEGTTKQFDVIVSLDGEIQDISGDVVRFVAKASKTAVDGAAVIDVTADVTTDGEQGKAAFTLSAAETSVSPSTYYYDILWTLASTEVYVLESGRVQIVQRVADV